MALKIQNTKTAINRVAIMLYGSAGAGKTTLCGTAPNPFIISAEGGLLSLRHMELPFTEVSSFQDVRDALVWCRTVAPQHGIQTICLDSISEIAEVCLSDNKKKTKDPRAAYGDMATQVIEIVKEFRDLTQFNVVVTCKATTAVDPITGVPKASPQAPGQQIGPALPFLFDEVFHVATDKDAEGKTYHYIRTHAAHNAEAKDRSGALDEIEYPDLAHIIGKILAPVA